MERMTDDTKPDGNFLSVDPKTTPEQARENAQTARDNQGSVPDRADTGGGPIGGNTVDGRTGPGRTGQQGAPVSTLRDDGHYSGDGNLGNADSDDELGTIGGVDEFGNPSTGKQDR